MKQKHRVNKTKEQIAKELQNKQEISRKRQIIIHKFYPALIKATISVDESKMLLQAMSSLLMQEVMKTMKERKFDDIIKPLFDVLCTDGQREKGIMALLETFKGENLFVARELIEGMSSSVEKMIADEMQIRKLDTLKTDWDRYLNS